MTNPHPSTSALLSAFPRVGLTHRPTPLEPMPNLTRLLGGPALYVKRDDCTGLAMGGNKARQLEFYFGEAIALQATTVLITGAVQSNYVRSTAAAAAKLGLSCEAQLEHRVQGMGGEYQASGNVLLDRLFGARIHHYPVGEDETGADRALEDMAARVRQDGGRPYIIHLAAGHPPLGALGYVEAAHELLDQAAQLGIAVDALVVPSGSAATHAGLLVGLRAAEQHAIAVYGICVRRNRAAQAARVFQCASAVADLLGCRGVVREHDVLTLDDYLGPGYGRLAPGTLEAIELAARMEGLLVDPVYSGKTLAGVIGLSRQGVLARGQRVVFLHTGGTPALFAYRDQLVESRMRQQATRRRKR